MLSRSQSGKYQSQNGYTGTSCTTWSTCGLAQRQTTAPTASSNRVSEAQAAPFSSAEFRLCLLLTQCTKSFFIFRCVEAAHPAPIKTKQATLPPHAKRGQIVSSCSTRQSLSRKNNQKRDVASHSSHFSAVPFFCAISSNRWTRTIFQKQPNIVFQSCVRQL